MYPFVLLAISGIEFSFDERCRFVGACIYNGMSLPVRNFLCYVIQVRSDTRDDLEACRNWTSFVRKWVKGVRTAGDPARPVPDDFAPNRRLNANKREEAREKERESETARERERGKWV